MSWSWVWSSCLSCSSLYYNHQSPKSLLFERVINYFYVHVLIVRKMFSLCYVREGTLYILVTLDIPLPFFFHPSFLLVFFNHNNLSFTFMSHPPVFLLDSIYNTKQMIFVCIVLLNLISDFVLFLEMTRLPSYLWGMNTLFKWSIIWNCVQMEYFNSVYVVG